MSKRGAGWATLAAAAPTPAAPRRRDRHAMPPGRVRRPLPAPTQPAAAQEAPPDCWCGARASPLGEFGRAEDRAGVGASSVGGRGGGLEGWICDVEG
jgi:hypothetical protein